jgi:hypothetical protein
MNTSKRPLKHKAAKVISKQEAVAAGLPYYFTGVPCRKGHIAARHVRNRACRTCRQEWHAAHPDVHRKVARDWKKNNAGKALAINARRRAEKKKRTPPWLTKEHIHAMTALYNQAAWLTRITGVPWHVDHIVPLSGKNVSGLHIPNNLQVIPARENLKKGNKLASLKQATRLKK